ILCAKLDPGDIAQTREAAVGVAFQDDVAELLGRGEPTLRLDTELIGAAAVAEGRLADGAGGNLDILGAHGIDDFVNRQVPRSRQIRVDPDSHRVIASAEQARAADAGYA